MENLKFLIFGRLSGPINHIAICHALDYLASVNENFMVNRENSIEIYDVFDDLKYDLNFMDIELSDIDYESKDQEYRCSILQNNRKIGFILIDKFGRPRVMYDTLQATDLDPRELEAQLELLLTSSRSELIDNIMGILHFTRPIPLSSDIFLLSISDEDAESVIKFFDLVYGSRKQESFDKPHFVSLDNNIQNMNSLSDLVADKMNEALSSFTRTKDEFYNGFSKDLTVNDIEIIDRLIDLTEDDISFYENRLKKNISEKIDRH